MKIIFHSDRKVYFQILRSNVRTKEVLEHPNITWEQLTTHLIKKDLCYTMSADGWARSSSNEKLVNVEKQLKSLQEGLQSHRVNAMNINPQNPLYPFLNFTERRDTQ